MLKSYLSVLLGSLGGFLIGASGAIAQEVFTFEPLPEPPPVIPLFEDATPTPTLYDSSVVTPVPTTGQEYIFEAPTGTPTTTVTPWSGAAARYRVDVLGTNPSMLATVRLVEPGAFIKGDRIQVGLFSERANAEALRSDLLASGVMAEIIDTGSGSAFGTEATISGARTGGYFVAIPSRGREQAIQTQLQQMGIQQSLIEARTAPRGPHIAIGPFTQREEAELMNVRVRLVDLDGRLYFQN
ncbi:hypothetical protein NIES970_01600 [[Synechococcus] sp. NIES-970]|nr:hypothetical protein NIES970_01600 [[Synechococcus] sp. NIES-970]